MSDNDNPDFLDKKSTQYIVSGALSTMTVVTLALALLYRMGTVPKIVVYAAIGLMFVIVALSGFYYFKRRNSEVIDPPKWYEYSLVVASLIAWMTAIAAVLLPVKPKEEDEGEVEEYDEDIKVNKEINISNNKKLNEITTIEKNTTYDEDGIAVDPVSDF